jgi:predicted esterase
LEQAASNGFAHLEHFETDTDIDSLRDSPGYARVREMVAANLSRHRAELIREAASVPPITIRPRGADLDGPLPLIIALHGHGGQASEFPQVWGPAAQEVGAILAVPQGAKRVGNGRAWSDVNEADAIVRMTIDYVRSRFEVDWDRVVLTGFSQGGFMAMAVAIRHPGIFAGVIPMAGPYLPGIDTPPPAEPGDPLYYFMVGSLDRVEDQVQQAASDFENAGYEVELRINVGTGHTFPRATKKELVRALRFVLNEE